MRRTGRKFGHTRGSHFKTYRTDPHDLCKSPYFHWSARERFWFFWSRCLPRKWLCESSSKWRLERTMSCWSLTSIQIDFLFQWEQKFTYSRATPHGCTSAKSYNVVGSRWCLNYRIWDLKIVISAQKGAATTCRYVDWKSGQLCITLRIVKVH